MCLSTSVWTLGGNAPGIVSQFPTLLWATENYSRIIAEICAVVTVATEGAVDTESEGVAGTDIVAASASMVIGYRSCQDCVWHLIMDIVYIYSFLLWILVRLCFI